MASPSKASDEADSSSTTRSPHTPLPDASCAGLSQDNTGSSICTPTDQQPELLPEEFADLYFTVSILSDKDCQDVVATMDPKELKSIILQRALQNPNDAWTQKLRGKMLSIAKAAAWPPEHNDVAALNNFVAECINKINEWKLKTNFEAQDTEAFQTMVQSAVNLSLDNLGIHGVQSKGWETKRAALIAIHNIATAVLQIPFVATQAGRESMRYDAVSRAVSNIMKSTQSKDALTWMLSSDLDKALVQVAHKGQTLGVFTGLEEVLFQNLQSYRPYGVPYIEENRLKPRRKRARPPADTHDSQTYAGYLQHGLKPGIAGGASLGGDSHHRDCDGHNNDSSSSSSSSKAASKAGPLSPIPSTPTQPPAYNLDGSTSESPQAGNQTAIKDERSPNAQAAAAVQPPSADQDPQASAVVGEPDGVSDVALAASGDSQTNATRAEISNTSDGRGSTNHFNVNPQQGSGVAGSDHPAAADGSQTTAAQAQPLDRMPDPPDFRSLYKDIYNHLFENPSRHLPAEQLEHLAQEVAKMINGTAGLMMKRTQQIVQGVQDPEARLRYVKHGIFGLLWVWENCVVDQGGSNLSRGVTRSVSADCMVGAVWQVISLLDEGEWRFRLLQAKDPSDHMLFEFTVEQRMVEILNVLHHQGLHHFDRFEYVIHEMRRWSPSHQQQQQQQQQ